MPTRATNTAHHRPEPLLPTLHGASLALIGPWSALVPVVFSSCAPQSCGGSFLPLYRGHSAPSPPNNKKNSCLLSSTLFKFTLTSPFSQDFDCLYILFQLPSNILLSLFPFVIDKSHSTPLHIPPPQNFKTTPPLCLQETLQRLPMAPRPSPAISSLARSPLSPAQVRCKS